MVEKVKLVKSPKVSSVMSDSCTLRQSMIPTVTWQAHDEIDFLPEHAGRSNDVLWENNKCHCLKKTHIDLSEMVNGPWKERKSRTLFLSLRADIHMVYAFIDFTSYLQNDFEQFC